MYVGTLDPEGLAAARRIHIKDNKHTMKSNSDQGVLGLLAVCFSLS